MLVPILEMVIVHLPKVESPALVTCPVGKVPLIEVSVADEIFKLPVPFTIVDVEEGLPVLLSLLEEVDFQLLDVPLDGSGRLCGASQTGIVPNLSTGEVTIVLFWKSISVLL